MAEIFTQEWYELITDQANKTGELKKKAPPGEWRMAMEVVGDGKSPYVSKGITKNLLILLKDGVLVEYREFPEKISGKNLNYRFTAEASIFEGIAAGKLDPVTAGLSGTITIRGDMRLLMQHTELMDAIYSIYVEDNPTEWPKGKPPY
jgi:putative sterol carrier protein